MGKHKRFNKLYLRSRNPHKMREERREKRENTSLVDFCYLDPLAFKLLNCVLLAIIITCITSVVPRQRFEEDAGSK
jgi:hypothetical protein